MFRRIVNKLGLTGAGPPEQLLTVDPDEVGFAITSDGSFPRVDWGAVDLWASHRAETESQRKALVRAAGAVWLDMVAKVTEGRPRRWRRGVIEGLAPTINRIDVRTERTADRAIRRITSAFRRLLDDEPPDPVAVIAFTTSDEYYDFIVRTDQEGERAGSIGSYMNEGSDCLPVVACYAQLINMELELTIAHELTHHVLRPFEIPKWIEEGLTQMMEELVIGHTSFGIDHDIVQRHRAHWDEESLSRYFNGWSFSWPHGEEPALAYHLSQAIVRTLLTDDPAAFFRFVRAAKGSTSGREAAIEIYDRELHELAGGLVKL